MAKKPKKIKGSQHVKKQTAAQQKKAARAAARKTANKATTLAKQGIGKTVARKAAEFAQIGYKSKTALAAAKNARGTTAQAHAERVKAISAKLQGRNEIQQIIDEYLPNAKYHSDTLADLIAQGKYEEYAEEYHMDLHRYEKMLYDKAMDAAMKGDSRADELMDIADYFAELLKNR